MPARTTAKLLGPTSRYALIQGSYWACYCSIITFSSVYLLFRGFSNSQIGVLISAAGVLSAVLQPFVSRLADGLRRMSLRQFSALLVLFQLAAGSLLLLLPGRLPQTILYALLLILIQLVMPLCSALGMACINSGLALNFGVARSGGSIAYGIFSALCGQLVLWFGALSIPVAMTILNLIFLVAVFTFKFKGVEGEPEAINQSQPEKTSGKPFFLKYRRVLWILFGIVCLLISHNVLNTYAFQIIQPLGGRQRTDGNHAYDPVPGGTAGDVSLFLDGQQGQQPVLAADLGDRLFPPCPGRAAGPQHAGNGRHPDL